MNTIPKRIIGNLCMLVLIAHSSMYGQIPVKSKLVTENEKLIEASQAGTMPLFFDVKSAGTPLITPDTFRDSAEFQTRGGLPNSLKKSGIKNK